MRVLVVEDELEIRQAVARRLRAGGHGVDEAVDGDEAESFIASYSYDVLVLDRMLPDGDSLERLERWRSGGLVTPALFLTARDQVSDRVAGFEAGADDYLVKPFAMDELVARVSALGRRGASMRPSRLEVADLVIDFSRREVRRGGVLLPLRPKEYAVLELLAGQAGRVVSRERLVAGCWGEEKSPGSNVEEVVVAALRRKLGKPPLIHTVRGVGYRLEDQSAERAGQS